MKFQLSLLVLLSLSAGAFSQNLIKKAQNAVNNATGGGSGSGSKLTNEEITRGLKEALSLGANNASARASKPDGFFKNPSIRIPFPPQARVVESKARQVGLGSQVDRFVLTMNRAAEEAAKESAPIFVNAVKSMTITDGLNILRGGDHAATNFLKSRTTAELTTKFTPVVKRAIQKVELTRFWNPVINSYNRIPGVKRQNPNLEAYITEKAIEGLFTLIGEEESKIRKDPAARVNDILKKVFGN